MESKFENIKTYLEHVMENESGEWMMTENKYRIELNMIKIEDRKSLRRRLSDWDTQKCKKKF